MLNHKELIVQVYSQPLIQELLDKKLMSKRQLIEWVLKEQEVADEEDQIENNDEPESDNPPEESPKGDTSYVKRLRLPIALGLNAATTILKIVRQIDNELNIKKTPASVREPADSDDVELQKIAMANTNTEKRMHRHVKVDDAGNLLPGDLLEKSLVNFFNVINSIKNEDYSKITQGNQQDFLKLNNAIASALKGVTPTSIDQDFQINGGGATFKVSNDSIVEIIKFIGIINTEKKSLIERAKEILKKKGGYTSTSTLSDMSKEILNDLGAKNVPDNISIKDVYSILELLHPETP